MKRLVIILIASLILIGSVQGANNNSRMSLWQKIKLIKSKLARSDKQYKGPVAVAGVRGDDVSSVRKSPVKPSDLIWEE